MLLPVASEVRLFLLNGESDNLINLRLLKGPNDDQLYVTTAHCSVLGGDASRQVLYPHSGDVFQVDLSGRFRGGKWRHNFVL